MSLKISRQPSVIIRNKMKKRNALYKSFIYFWKIGIPAAVATLFMLSVKSWSHIFFLIFMTAHCLERVWETFYTTEERKSDEFHGDWTLAWATVVYIMMCFFVTFEFYLLRNDLNLRVTLIGLLLYAFAFFLRHGSGERIIAAMRLKRDRKISHKRTAGPKPAVFFFTSGERCICLFRKEIRSLMTKGVFL